MIDVSYQFMLMATLVFFMVLCCGVLLIFTTTRKSKSSKEYDRLMGLRQMTDDEIMKQVIDSSNYQSLLAQRGFSYISKNSKQYMGILKTLRIDVFQIELLIKKANDDSVSAAEIAFGKVIGLVGALILALGAVISPSFLGIALLFYFYYAFFPEFKLKDKYKKRKYEFQQKLPFFLDLVTHATEVGKSVEEACEIASNRYDCIVSDEFKAAAKETEYSNDWIQSLVERSLFSGIDEFESVVSEIRTSKERGTPITDTLKNLRENILREAVISLEEHARQKSTTIIIPIFIFLFFPMIMLILLPLASTAMGVF